MYPPITYSLLVSKAACRPQLDLFKKHFGLEESVPLTLKTVTKFGRLFDVDWAAKNFLTPKDFKEYNKFKSFSLEKYNRVYLRAAMKYEKITTPAWEKYNPDWEKYNKVTTPIWVEFNKITNAALKEFDKDIAQEFVRIYKKGIK